MDSVGLIIISDARNTVVLMVEEMLKPPLSQTIYAESQNNEFWVYSVFPIDIL